MTVFFLTVTDYETGVTQNSIQTILLLLKDQSVVCLATRQIKAFGNKLVLAVRRKTTHNCRTLNHK